MKRPKYALFGPSLQEFKCLGAASTPSREAAWDMAALAGAAWGAWIGNRYNRPATGAFIGAAAPVLAHWLVFAYQTKFQKA